MEELRAKRAIYTPSREPEYCSCAFSKNARDEHVKSEELARKEIESNLTSRMRSYGFPDRYVRLTSRDFISHKTNKLSEEQFLSLVGHKGNISILGEAGIGKTAIACTIAKELISKTEGHAAFATVQDIVRVTKGYSSGEDILKRYRFAQVLVLDDLGIEKTPTPFETRAIFDIINERYSHGYKTIITSNLSMKELAEAYGVRIVDRLNEEGIVVKLTTWKNLRAESTKASNSAGKFVMEL